MSIEPQLRTAAWHGDSLMDLPFPASWDVCTYWPNTPPRLDEAQIVDRVEHPVAQPRISVLCRGKSRPLILVDDVNRPTPAAKVIPFLLKEFQAAGISLPDVTILIARGSHGPPHQKSIVAKVGNEAFSNCRVLLHDPYRHTIKMGTTTFGTPVIVNQQVPAADFVMGIGGVYPNNTAGFGGGAKLALGVLDIRVIAQLHAKHAGVGWGKNGQEGTFRRDLEEIAEMIGYRFLVAAHVNAERELIRVTCGDYRVFYKEEADFAKQAFRAPKPQDADVVISNAFPSDVSLTFVHMKGTYPLRLAAEHASRVVLAACSEGEGFHGVYPIVRIPRFHNFRERIGRLSLMSYREIAKKVHGRIDGLRPRFWGSPSAEKMRRANATPALKHKNPVWFYRTVNHPDDLPSPVRGMRIVKTWPQILEKIAQEQNGRERLKVVVYPCAPLQVLE